MRIIKPVKEKVEELQSYEILIIGYNCAFLLWMIALIILNSLTA